MPRPKNPKISGAALRRLRKARGWNVAELARRARKHGGDFTAASVQGWEAGYYGPEPARLIALARTLGVPPETLAAPAAPILER